MKKKDKNSKKSDVSVQDVLPKRLDSDDFTENELLIYKDIRQARRKKRQKRRKRILILCMIAVLAVFAYFNWDTLAPTSLADSIQSFFGGFKSGKFPIILPQGNFKQAVQIGNNIGVLTDTAFFIYSQSGGELVERQHGMSDPQVAANGGKAVLYDRGDKQFRVETRLDEPFSVNTDNPIITAAVGKSGNFAVVTESNKYLSELTVYDLGYKNVFKWYCSNGHILNVSLSPDGSRVAAIVVSAKGGDMVSSIYIFKISQTKPLKVINLAGNLCFSVQYVNNDEISVIGDKQAAFISNDGSKQSVYSYNDKTLKCYSNSSGSSVLVLKKYGSGNESSIVSLSGAGKVIGQADIDENINGVYADTGHIVALSDRSVWRSGIDCKSKSTLSTSGDKNQVLIFKNDAYFFGLQSMYKYNISSSANKN